LNRKGFQSCCRSIIRLVSDVGIHVFAGAIKYSHNFGSVMLFHTGGRMVVLFSKFMARTRINPFPSLGKPHLEHQALKHYGYDLAGPKSYQAEAEVSDISAWEAMVRME
jgi:hypothetical protein